MGNELKLTSVSTERHPTRKYRHRDKRGRPPWVCMMFLAILSILSKRATSTGSNVWVDKWEITETDNGWGFTKDIVTNPATMLNADNPYNTYKDDVIFTDTWNVQCGADHCENWNTYKPSLD